MARVKRKGRRAARENFREPQFIRREGVVRKCAEQLRFAIGQKNEGLFPRTSSIDRARDLETRLEFHAHATLGRRGQLLERYFETVCQGAIWFSFRDSRSTSSVSFRAKSSPERTCRE